MVGLRKPGENVSFPFDIQISVYKHIVHVAVNHLLCLIQLSEILSSPLFISEVLYIGGAC